jgi:transcription elongation factor Elf1
MDRLTELDFVHTLPLRNRRKHSKGFNFSCDVCNDKKKRGYLLIGHDKIVIHCFNCGLNTNLRKYLQLYEPSMFDEYLQVERKEKLENLHQGIVSIKKEVIQSPVINTNIDNLSVFKFNKKYFIPASENKDCVDYCKQRKIPDEILQTLKYCTHPTNICSGMLIFPCYWKDGEHVYAFQGRSLSDKRFYIHSKHDSFKVYGIFQVDLTKPIYIFESIIDSYCKKNSIAMMGSDISLPVLRMIEKPVMCMDNDLTGLRKTLKYAENGCSVFIWPTGIKGKDCNELMEKWNWSAETIENMIKGNIYDKFAAVAILKLRLRNKKK